MTHQDSNSDTLHNRVQGRRKSKFPVITNIPTDATLDFVSNGTNFKITLADFLAALNVTGTIEQEGSVNGTPVLDKQGTENNIRNLENGPGIVAALSPQNGIKLSHNFTSGESPSGMGVGIPILTNITALSPTIRSAVAGDGMQIFANNGSITFRATGGLASTGTVIVSSLSDLPTPVGGVITLVQGTTYDPQGVIDISPNRFLINTTAVAFKSNNRLSRGFTTDNTGALFTATGLNSIPIIEDMIVLAPNGRVFDIQLGAGIAFNDVVNTSAAKASKVTAGGFISFRNYNIVKPLGGAFDPFGVEFFGACQEFNVSNGVFREWSGILFDFGTATFSNGLSLGPNARYEGSAGKIVMSGSAANIPAGALGQITHNKFLDDATITSGFDESTTGFEFLGNQGIDDTQTDGLLSMQGNATETVIASIGVPVLVAGTWVVEDANQMTGTTAGRLTNAGGTNERVPITASVTIEPVSGGAQSMSVYIAINGTFVANSKRSASAASATPISITAPWQIMLSTGDFVEIFVANDSATTNVLVSSAISRVN